VAYPLLLLGKDQRTEDWLRLAHSEGMEHHRLEMTWIVLEVLRGRTEAAIDRISSGLTRFAGELEFETFAADALLFLGVWKHCVRRSNEPSGSPPTWRTGP
jgi:hypothetical protein